MNLYIITRGRVGNQLTLQHIPPSWYDRTYLVCPPEEVNLHTWPDILVADVPDYSKKVQWCLDYIADNEDGVGVIMDDDLWWDKRDPERWEKMVKVDHVEEVATMFEEIEAHLAERALVSVHPRMMGNLAPQPYKENGKVVCLQAVNINLFPGQVVPKVDYDPILADVHLNLHLLSRGVPNRLVTNFVMNWGPSQAPGGCDYRTLEMQHKAVTRIAEMYAPYAQAVTKRPKQAKWLGDERPDLRIQWKRLFEDAPKEKSDATE